MGSDSLPKVANLGMPGPRPDSPWGGFLKERMYQVDTHHPMTPQSLVKQSGHSAVPSYVQVEQVNALLRAGHLDQAAQRIAELRSVFGQGREVLYLTALHHQASGRFQDSLVLADRLVSMPGNPMEAQILRSMCLICMNQVKAGVMVAEEVHAANPTDPKAALSVATARHFNNDPEGCLEVTEAWLGCLSSDGKLNFLRSWALEMLGRKIEAEAAYLRTIIVAPYQTLAWLHLVKMGCNVSIRNLEETLADENLSLRERSGAAFALAEVLKRRGEYPAAIEVSERGDRMIKDFNKESIESKQEPSNFEESLAFVRDMAVLA